MYEQTLTVGPDRQPPRPALSYRTMAVFRRVLLRAYRTVQSATRAVRTFGPINTARAWLASPLYRLRQAIAWGRTRTGLPTAGALGAGAFALSDRGQALLSRGRTLLSGLAAKAMTAVGRWLTRHPLPAPVRSAVSWVGGITRAALAPVKTLMSRGRLLVRRVGLTARRGSYTLTTATAAKLVVPAVPVVLVAVGALAGLSLLRGYGSNIPTGSDPQDPVTVPSRDAAAAHASMEHLAEVLPKIRTAVKDAVAEGDKDAVRDARRLLSSCRARTGELKKAAAALRADGELPAGLLPTLEDIDTLVAEMNAEWAQLSAQLRDAAGNRGTRRAAASRARRQWSPTAAEAL